MQKWLNKFLYLPPLRTLLLNAVFFAVMLTLAIVFGLFSESINGVTSPFLRTDRTKGWTILILLLLLVGAFAVIYGRTEKYFLCPCQCLWAAGGTTLVVTLVYAGVWSLIQIGKKNQDFVLFKPAVWNGQVTLNNLKYGGLLFLFSSLSLAGSLAISGRLGYDFGPLADDWKSWKQPVNKLNNNQPLEPQEHTSLVNTTASLLKKIDEISGYVQPVSRSAAERAREPLRLFKEWYEKQTDISYAHCKGLDAAIRPQAHIILSLC